ncbi:MAG: hypothetical protein H7A25_12110 [Leptospiraceae bacterium]|nr:hypothetical protein [Leptospiraceae bacterium]
MLVFLVSCNKKKKDDLILLLGLAAASQSQAASTSTSTGTTTGTGTGTTTGTGTGTATGTGTGTTSPSGLSYSGSPFTFTKNTAITTQTPTVTGTVTSCTSSPSLPAGLSIDSTSCALSGTPTASQAATSYTITATNSGGSTTTTISITVNGLFGNEGYIKAANANASDGFGRRVAIDSDTLVVGAQNEASNQTTITNGTTASTDNSLTSAGAVYVYKRSGTTWAQEAYLKAPNAKASYLFGCSVAISSDTIVVGSEGEKSNQTTITNGTTASTNETAVNYGAAYVFKRSGTIWAQEAYLKAPNSESNDYFGNAVAISSDTIAVAAHREASNQTTITNGTTASADNSISRAGAVYVFKRSGTTWTQEAYLKPPVVASSSEYFGESVAISSDTIVVGAHYEDSNQTTITNGTTASTDNSASNAGAAYVFKRNGTTWAQEAYLKASNAGAGDMFGRTVSIYSDTIAVGADGEQSNQTTITNGTTASSNNDTYSGAVYVFKRSGTTWIQEAYLKAPNNGNEDAFGGSISIDTDTIVVGAYQEDSNQTTITNGTTASADNSASDSGAVYVFKRNGTIWSQDSYLKAPNAQADDTFGESVSISSDTIVVGASQEDSNQTTISTTASADNSAIDSGAVYVFKR